MDYINGLVQGRCNSSALAMELHLSCTYLSTFTYNVKLERINFSDNGHHKFDSLRQSGANMRQ